MTKNERILRKQIKELERLVEIKDEVIIELKSLIRPTYNPYTTPFYTGPIYGTGDSVTITNGTGNTTTLAEDIPFTLTDGVS